MPILYVKNKSTNRLMIGGLQDSNSERILQIPARKDVKIEISGSDLERIRSTIITLSKNGSIDYTVTEIPGTLNDQLELATVQMAKDEGGGNSADEITYDNTTSGLAAINVQDAIDEIVGATGGLITSVFGRTGAIIAEPGDYNASQVDYDNITSGLMATDVQNAIDELQTNKADLAGQIGGTAISPDVRGIRETSGPTLLDIGAISDGEYLRRSGTSLIGDIPSGGASLTSNPPVNVTKAPAAVGVSTEAARADHKHDITTAAPVTIGSINSEGSSTSLARADHVHSHGDQAGGSLHSEATTTVAGFMSGADKTKLDGIATGAQVNTVDSIFGRTGAVTATAGDYSADEVDYNNVLSGLTATDVQDAIDELQSTKVELAGQLGGSTTSPDVRGLRETSGPTLLTLGSIADGEVLTRSGSNLIGTVPAAGVTLTNNPPVNVTKAAAVIGVSTEAARADHKHDISTATPSTIGTVNMEGSSTSLARADHIHSHGDQAGGSLHAEVIAAGASGFMSGADKNKLDGIAPGAQVNTVTSVHGRTGAVVGVLGDYTLNLIPVPTTGTPTLVTQSDDAYRRIWSAGSVSGFDLTDNGNGTITITAGEGILRTDALSDAELRSVSCPGGAPTLINNSVNYIYFEWNSGTPQLGSTTSISGFNCQNSCLLYTISREGNILSIFDARRMNVDSNRKLKRKLFETERLRRVQGGSTLGDAGTRRITVTSGAFYYALNRLDHTAFDTTVAGIALPNVFTYRYRNGVGGWTTIDNQKQINNTQYDNGTGALATLGNSRYRTDWVYLIPGSNSRLIIVFGRNNDNSLAEAQTVSAPTDLPPLVTSAGVLIGKIIIERDATEIALVSSAFENGGFTFVPIINHTDLSGLQGGTTNEYYHLTLAEHTDVVDISVVSNDRLLYRDPSGDIVGLAPLALTSTAPVNVTKSAAVVGVSMEAARADHKHDITTAAPVTIGSANTEGSSTSLARADHVHSHGDQAGGSLHAAATTTVNGFMSGADKLKLDGIASGAQVNTVTSVFGRTGAVTADSGDYDADQVTFDPSGLSNITGTDVQAAIASIDSQLGGGGGAPSIVVVGGYDTSNSYQTAINQLPGSTSFTAIWYGYLLGLLHGAPQFLMGNHNMSGHGWAIIAGARNLGSASYLQFEVFDGTGFADVSSEILEAHDYVMHCMRPLHLAIRYDGGSARGFINGQATRFDGTGTGFTAASGARFMVGNNPSVWNEPATRAGFAGAGYISSGLTETQIQDHFQACREANNRFVAGAISWEHRYDVLAPGGSFPTQIDDLVGSAHLERVGTSITGTTTYRV